MLRRTQRIKEIAEVTPLLQDDTDGWHGPPTIWIGPQPLYEPDFPMDLWQQFTLRKTLKGSVRSLGRIAYGICEAGELEGRPIASLYVGKPRFDDHPVTLANFYFRLPSHEALEADNIFSIAARGVYQYLHGYDEVTSSDISEQIFTAYSAGEDNAIRAHGWRDQQTNSVR